MIVIPDNVCVNDSIFCATDTASVPVFWKEPPGNPNRPSLLRTGTGYVTGSSRY